MLNAVTEASAVVLYPGQATAELPPADAIRQERAQSTKGIPEPDDCGGDCDCVLGVPIDAVELAENVRRINVAAARATPFLLSTVNLNYLISAAANAEFRESLLLSDLCPADGMPIVWIARLLGLPIKQRAAGSDTFDALRAAQGKAQQLTLFLFGGAKGAAVAAANTLNQEAGGVRCVGALYP